jgi:hypothetical protein
LKAIFVFSESYKFGKSKIFHFFEVLMLLLTREAFPEIESNLLLFLLDVERMELTACSSWAFSFWWNHIIEDLTEMSSGFD